MKNIFYMVVISTRETIVTILMIIECPENVPWKNSSLDCDFWTWYFKAPFPEIKGRVNKWTNLFGGVFEKNSCHSLISFTKTRLAGAHYSDDYIEWMSKNFNFVGKQINLPNVPQARLIESFLVDLAQKFTPVAGEQNHANN